MGKIDRKKIITYLTIIVIVILVIIAIKNKWFFSETSNYNTTGFVNDGEDGETKKHNEVELEGDIKIDISQIVSAEEPVVVDFYVGKEKEPNSSKQIEINDYYYSRKLEDTLIFNEKYIDRYGQGIFNESGDILKDYYYLYVDFTVTNKGEEEAYAPRNNDYIIIDADNIIHYDLEADQDNIYIQDYNHIFGAYKMLNSFKTDTSIQFGLVYLVTDEEVEGNRIHIYPNIGETGIEALSKKENRFITLDLIGKER